ncbi:unnamed protein product [Urochloa humidicola]
MGDGGASSRADDDENDKASSSGFLRTVWFRQMIHRWQSSSSSAATNAKRSGADSECERGNEPAASTDQNSCASAVGDRDPVPPALAAEPARRPLLLPRVVEERGGGGGGSVESPPMTAAPADVPRGCCPVYVGAERRRFVVPTAYLGMPVFGRLLEKAAEEFEFHYVAGGVTIPCDTEAFKYILLVMDRHRRGLVDDEGNAKDGGDQGGSSSSQQAASPTTSPAADVGVTTGANAEAIVVHGTTQ